MATIKQQDLEAKVLDALAHHLMDPEAVSAFCEAYTAERNRLAAAATSTRGTMEKELATTKRDHAKLVDAIIAGVPADQVKDKMPHPCPAKRLNDLTPVSTPLSKHKQTFLPGKDGPTKL